MKRHLGDFIEEEGSAPGFVDEAALVGAGVGESAAAVTENLAFEQVFRNAGGMHGAEFPLTAGIAVNQFGHAAFADSGFAE